MGDVDVLIPGIENDVTRAFIVPRLPFDAFRVLSWVSRTWRRAIKTRQIYDMRVRSNSTESLALFLSVKEASAREEDGSELRQGKSAISLYSMRENCISHLRPLPTTRDKVIRHFRCVSLNGNMYSLGGATVSDDHMGWVYVAVNEVYVMDVAGMNWEWKQCASMGGERAEFGCGTMGGKIYVFGGWSSRGKFGSVTQEHAEVYDPMDDTWSPIKMGSRGLGEDPVVAAMGEELLVYNRISFWPRPRNFLVARRYYPAYVVEAYNPCTNEWRHVRDFNIQPQDEIKALVIVGEKILKFGCDCMYAYDVLSNGWNRAQSCVFKDLEPRFHGRIIPWRMVVLDGELLFAGYSYKNDLPHQFIFLKSRGLGSENEEIIWYAVPEFSPIFPGELAGSFQF